MIPHLFEMLAGVDKLQRKSKTFLSVITGVLIDVEGSVWEAMEIAHLMMY